MSLLSLVLSLSIACLGVLSIVSPDFFSDFLRHLQTPTGMYFAAGFRLIFGASLVLSAPKSRAPDILRGLGWLFLVAAVLIPVFGFDFFRSVIDFFLSLGPWAARLWGLVAMAFGLGIAYGVAPGSRAAM